MAQTYSKPALDLAVKKAVEAERDRCAKIAEATYADPAWHAYYLNASASIANLIRKQEAAPRAE